MKRRGPALFVLLLAAVGAAGTARALDDSEAGVIHACYQEHRGALRIAQADACLPSELPISWNVEGPPGPAGPTGPPGEAGAPGPAGPPLAHAHVLADGTIDAARTSSNVLGVSRSTVAGSRGALPLYCFDLGDTADNLVVTVENSLATFLVPGPGGINDPVPTVLLSLPGVNASVAEPVIATFGCPAGAEAAVALASGGAAGRPFYVTFN